MSAIIPKVQVADFLRTPSNHLKLFAEGSFKLDQTNPSQDIDYSPAQPEKRYTYAVDLCRKVGEASAAEAVTAEDLAVKKSASSFFSGFEVTALTILAWAISFFKENSDSSLRAWCKETFANVVAGAVKRALQQPEEVIKEEDDEPVVKTSPKVQYIEVDDAGSHGAPVFNLPDNLPLPGIATDLRFPVHKRLVAVPYLPSVEELDGRSLGRRCAPAFNLPANLPLPGIATVY